MCNRKCLLINEDQKIAIIEKYNNKVKITEIFKEFGKPVGFTESGFKKFLNRNITVKRFPINIKLGVNHNFFDELKEIQCYLLGFYLADGNLFTIGNSYRIAINVSFKDKYILDLFKEYIAPNNPIITRLPKPFISVNNKTYQGVEQSKIVITSNKIGKYFKDLGFSENKTQLVKRVPNLNDDQFLHFLRGYFDGDGCISIGKHKGGHCYKRFQLTSFDEQILIDIRNRLEILGVKTKIYSERNHFHILVQNTIELVKLYDLLYQNCKFYFKRKEEIFKLVKKTLRELEDLKFLKPRNA